MGWSNHSLPDDTHCYLYIIVYMHHLWKNTVETISTQKLLGNLTIQYKEMANTVNYIVNSTLIIIFWRFWDNLLFLYCVLNVGCLISWLPSLKFHTGKARQHLHTIYSNTWDLKQRGLVYWLTCILHCIQVAVITIHLQGGKMGNEFKCRKLTELWIDLFRTLKCLFFQNSDVLSS